MIEGLTEEDIKKAEGVLGPRMQTVKSDMATTKSAYWGKVAKFQLKYNGKSWTVVGNYDLGMGHYEPCELCGNKQCRYKFVIESQQEQSLQTLMEGSAQKATETYTEKQERLSIGDECVRPGTMLLGDNVRAKNLMPGMAILGASGHQHVKAAMSRRFNGRLVRIAPSGMLPIDLTPNHPILVRKSILRRGKIAGFTHGEWKKASTLLPKLGGREGEYVVLPHLSGSYNLRKVDLLQFAYGRGALIAQWQHVPIALPLNEQTAWLLGLYVAEGWSDTKARSERGREVVTFSLNIAERDIAEKAESILHQLGYKTHERSQGNALVINVMSRLLARAMRAWCGHLAPNKKVPDFILLHRNRRLLKSFLDGYWKGDGSLFRSKLNHLHGAGGTTSRLLALQIQLLGARIGLPVNISRTHRAPKSHIGDREINQKTFYPIHFGELVNVRGKRLRVYGGNVLAPIKKVSRIKYNGRVYNCETPDNTYLVSNAIVHNCVIQYVQDTDKDKEKAMRKVRDMMIKESRAELNRGFALELYALADRLGNGMWHLTWDIRGMAYKLVKGNTITKKEKEILEKYFSRLLTAPQVQLTEETKATLMTAYRKVYDLRARLIYAYLYKDAAPEVVMACAHDILEGEKREKVS